MYKVNEFQTEITDALLDSLRSEVKDNLLEAINSVPFIHNLISPERKRARDLPKDSKGRIIVDICNPHILEDMEYFTPAARHFKEHGCYTLLRPNSNPNSPYYKWAREEIRRCRDGYVRPSDGEWIPGEMYFQLNYCPMLVNKIVEGTKVAERVEDFPEIWEGTYLRYHYIHQARYGGLYNDFKGGNHAAELARRGCGKSYSLAAIMAKRLLLGESESVTRRVTTILTAYLSEYLAEKDGTLSKFVPVINHCALHTNFPKNRVINSMSDMIWQMGYKEQGSQVTRGSLNTVMGISVKDNEAKIRGKRGYICVEEFGSFSNLLSVYNNIRHSVEEGDFTYGLIYLVGTAGDKDSDFAAAQELMYHPSGYNIYALPNVFDLDSRGRPQFSFFFPGYLNRKGNYNKDGVSDVIKSLIEIYNKRYETKYDSSRSDTLLKTIAEIPVTPQEAILKVHENIFPTSDLSERLAQIDGNPRFYDDIYVGELSISNGLVEYKPTNDMVIREFPIKNNNLHGAIEFYSMPKKDSSGKPPQNRYYIGVDPYENDKADSSSLGSVFVADLFSDEIVAEYTGRPTYADDFFEIVRRLALFYNAKILYENNKKGLYGYFQKMNSLYLLEDSLEFLKDKQLFKGQTFGNSSKGVWASPAVNGYGRQLLRDWLLKNVSIPSDDPEGDPQTYYNLYRIKGRAFLKELISYNPAGNFDRVSAAGILMLFRQHYMIMYQGEVDPSAREERAKSLANDPFFSKNYDKKVFGIKSRRILP